MRGVYLLHGQVVFIYNYTKVGDQFTPHQVPWCVGKLVMDYLLKIRPIEEYVASILFTDAEVANYQEYWLPRLSNRWTSADWSVALGKWTEQYFKCKLTVNPLRHVMVAIGNQYVRKTSLTHVNDAVEDQQAHHSTTTAQAHYGASAHLINTNRLYMFCSSSRNWHNVIGVGAYPPPPPLFFRGFDTGAPLYTINDPMTDRYHPAVHGHMPGVTSEFGGQGHGMDEARLVASVTENVLLSMRSMMEEFTSTMERKTEDRMKRIVSESVVQTLRLQKGRSTSGSSLGDSVLNDALQPEGNSSLVLPRRPHAPNRSIVSSVHTPESRLAVKVTNQQVIGRTAVGFANQQAIPQHATLVGRNNEVPTPGSPGDEATDAMEVVEVDRQSSPPITEYSDFDTAKDIALAGMRVMLGRQDMSWKCKVQRDLMVSTIGGPYHGKDIIGVATTGSGKSCLFYVPALTYNRDQTTVVVSPYRALECQMVDSAKKLGINYLNWVGSSKTTQKEQPSLVIVSSDRAAKKDFAE